jgi:hypothetical protein
MGTDPWFPFYCNDWLSSPRVASMNLAEQALYLKLLCYLWMSGDCSLPNDEDKLRRMAVFPRNSTKIVYGDDDVDNVDFRRVLACFDGHPTKEGHLTNGRMFQEWNRTQNLKKSKSESGKRGAAKRWQTHVFANGESIAKDSHSQSQSHSTTQRKGHGTDLREWGEEDKTELRRRSNELAEWIPLDKDKPTDLRYVVGTCMLVMMGVLFDKDVASVLAKCKRKPKTDRFGYFVAAFRGIVSDRSDGTTFEEMLSKLHVPSPPFAK